jgi:FkbM family methyltransferase
MESYQLPDGRTIAHARAQETDKIYKDIFLDRIYLQEGIELPPDPVVIDAGANIGLFTLFVLEVCPSARICAIEPAPRTVEILRRNTAAYGAAVTVLHCGVGAGESEMEFTYFPNLTAGSGFYDEDQMQRIRDIRRSLILADPVRAKQLDTPVGEELVNYIIDRNLECEVARIPVRPLGALVDELGIGRIDLLKLDVEGSELPALHGIRDDQWPQINQMVIEVHHTKRDGDELLRILRGQGFQAGIHADPMIAIGGKSMIYARRPAAA